MGMVVDIWRMQKEESGEGQPRLRRGQDIAERMLDFGADALRLTSKLPITAIGRHISLQLVRSATGAGANYEEARGAESSGDFAHKIGVASKEIREALYWVQLLARSGWVREDLRGMIAEAAELTAILGASVRTARRRRAEEERRK
jgi:four helix bundle protein